MRGSVLLLSTVFCLIAPSVQAAGVRFFDVPAEASSPKLTGAVWYPCDAPQQETKVGNRVITGTKDCPIIGGKLPLVVVSHGRTGSFIGHHDTNAALADAGFVVAAINHPGDTYSDSSRVDDLSVLVERPADIKRLVDFMLDGWPDASKIDRERIGLFGFSRGGYTGLVVVGGNPELRKGLPSCIGSTLHACQQLENSEIPTAPPIHDPRIKAAVIVDPGFGFLFPAENLKAVKIPIQLWSSDPELRANYLSGCCALGIKDRLPSKPDFHLATNAIHFSFLARCSSEDQKDMPRFCSDAPGFDRVAFHKDFHAAVIAFFRDHLVETAKP